jgi:hypothetical protein
VTLTRDLDDFFTRKLLVLGGNCELYKYHTLVAKNIYNYHNQTNSLIPLPAKKKSDPLLPLAFVYLGEASSSAFS